MQQFPSARLSAIPEVPIYPRIIKPPYVSDLPDPHLDIEHQIFHTQSWIYFDTADTFIEIRQFYKDWAIGAGWWDGIDNGGPLSFFNGDACPSYGILILPYKVEDDVTTIHIQVRPEACECMLSDTP